MLKRKHWFCSIRHTQHSDNMILEFKTLTLRVSISQINFKAHLVRRSNVSPGMYT